MRNIPHITPNWFASVMGTGIVAVSAATLPVTIPGLRPVATVIWLLAAVLLIALSAYFIQQWRAHFADQVMRHFYGAIPMAFLTVGAGTILLGPRLIGTHTSVVIDVVLWTIGTVIGVLTAVGVPYSIMVAKAHQEMPLPAWMMPIVPPMVSASTGALLLPHLANPQTFMWVLYLLAGLSLFPGLITITLVYGRLMQHGLPATQAVPTVWISLGVLGQGVTALVNIGAAAQRQFPPAQHDLGMGLHFAGVAMGLILAGFAIIVFAWATALTVHAARRGLTFSLTWWSFTFPIGTCVTGSGALGVALSSGLIKTVSVVLFFVLAIVWAVVAVNTLLGATRGGLLKKPAPAALTFPNGHVQPSPRLSRVRSRA